MIELILLAALAQQPRPPLTLKQCRLLNDAIAVLGIDIVEAGSARMGYTIDELRYAIVACRGK